MQRFHDSSELRYSESPNTRRDTALYYLDLTELAARIRSREISPVAAARAQLDRIAALDGALQSYALVMADAAMAQAEAAKRRSRPASIVGRCTAFPWR